MFARWRQAGLIWPTIFTIGALTVLCALGKWQLDRKAWKEGLIATLKQRGASAPIANADWAALACDAKLPAADARSCEYLPVRLEGTLRHDDERHVFTSGGPSTGGRPGYLIMTPLEFSSGSQNRLIYVNRGFVPETAKQPSQRATGQIAGPAQVSGLLRIAEPKASFTPEPDRAANRYYLRDPSIFVNRPDSPVSGGPDPLRYYIDQTGDAVAKGAPQPVGGKIEFSNRHLEYALTWFGLAATLIGVFGAFAWSRLRAASGS